MKKVLLLTAMITTLVSLQAQNLSFGPIASVGHGWTSADYSLKNRFHPTYSIGGRMVYSFTPQWGVSGDLRFSSEGQTIGNSSDDKTSIRANYIRVPLQGIYFFGDYGDRVRPKISAGPSFGFMVGGKTKNYDNNTVTTMKTKDFWKGADFGLTVAAGGNVRMSRAVWLNLDLSYYYGLTDVAESGMDSQNRGLGMNVGITFPLGTLMPDKLN